MVKVLTDSNIEQILSGSQPVLIDFWATWCGPCRALSPVVDEVAEELAGKVVVTKCNVDDCEEIAMKYGIRNIPTLIYVKNGEAADRSVGVVSKQEIIANLEKLM